MLDLEDWLSGRRQIPSNMLEDAVQRAADIVLGDTDSVMEYRKDRLTGHHSKNAGNNITMNVNGMVLYRNGVPKTAITYEGINADTIVTGSMLANYVRGGTLASLNDAFEADLNEGKWWFRSSATINFEDTRNALLFNRENITAGLGFDVGSGGTGRPITYLGSSDNYLTTNDPSWAGLIVSPQASQQDSSTFSSMTSRYFLIRDELNYNRGFMFETDGNTPTFRPVNAAGYDYMLGSGSNFFKRGYMQGIRVNEPQFTLSSTHSSGRGFVFDVEYESGEAHMSFRGLNAGSYWSNPRYYSLGRENSPFARGYINLLRGNFVGTSNNPFEGVYTDFVVENSDESVKEDIIDSKLGLDFIKDIRTVDYRMKDGGHYKNGVLAGEMEDVLHKHNIPLSEQGILFHMDDVPGISYTQLIAPLIKSVQEINERLERLENGTKPRTE